MRSALLLGVIVALAAVGAWLVLRPAPPSRAPAPHATVLDAPETIEAPGPEAKPALHPKLVGKVTGAEPLSGVRVFASWEGGGASGATDAKGAYALEVEPPEKAVNVKLSAEAPDGRVGFGRAWIDPASEENRAMDVALLPAAGVLFVTEPRAAASLEVTMVLERGGSPLPVPLPLLHTENGEARARLAVGKYELIARAEGFGRTKLAFEVDEKTSEVRVPLAPERRLKVLVRSKKDSTWVEGARLRLFESFREYGTPEAFTDAMGSAVLRGLNREDKLMLDVVGPGEVPQEEEPGPSPRQRHRVPADVDEMLVEIDLPRTISWLIEPGDIPAPPDGTVIPLRKSAGTLVTPPAQGVMRGGRLWTQGWPAMAAHGEALGPERTIARLFCAIDTDEGMPTKFLRGCNITVVVHHPDGAPALGVTVAIFNQGNNLMAKADTGDDGVAKLEKLEGRLADLRVLGASQWQRETIGTVDLRKGDLRVEYTLADRRRVEIRTLVDGKPMLPEGPQLYLSPPIQEFVADEEQALMTGIVRLHPGASKVNASFRAPGYLYEAADIAVPAGDGPIRHVFELRRGMELRVREVGKAPEGLVYELQIDRGTEWTTVDTNSRRMGIFPPPAKRPEDGGWTYTCLAPGTYRIRTEGGAIFGPVAIAEGGPAPEIALDYTKIAAIRGHVEVPEGSRINEAYLTLEGEGIDTDTYNPMFSNAIRPDPRNGRFEVFIPGDRKVTLSVCHRTLMSHPERGQVETVTGLDNVVLVLVQGPSLRLRIPDYFVKYAERFEKNPQRQRPDVEVRFFRGEPGARPEHTVYAHADDREWKGSGFAPGTYTLWIDVPESLPVVRRGVKLEEDTDLGELPMERGSTLRVRVLVKEPFAVPSMHVWANRLGDPGCSRGLNSFDGESVLPVTGIGPGRYRVTSGINTGVLGAGGPALLLDEEIEFDGVTDVERTIDLR